MIVINDCQFWVLVAQELLRGEGCVLEGELRWVRTLSRLRSSQVSMRVGSNVVLEVDVSMFLMF